MTLGNLTKQNENVKKNNKIQKRKKTKIGNRKSIIKMVTNEVPMRAHGLKLGVSGAEYQCGVFWIGFGQRTPQK